MIGERKRNRRRDRTRGDEAKAARLARKAAQLAKAYRIGAALPSPIMG